MNAGHFHASLLLRGLALLIVPLFALLLSDGMPHVAAQSEEALTLSEIEAQQSGVPQFDLLGGGEITEGEVAYFQIMHPPKTEIKTSVTIRQTGNFAVAGQLGTRIITTQYGEHRGQTTFRVFTHDDNRNESAGAITVTLNPGTGYTVGERYKTATIKVNDNDVPVVSITSGSAIREGGTASFSLTASPQPAEAMEVTVDVSDSGSFAASGQTGSRTVTIGTNGRGRLSVNTESDDIDEDDGAITASIAAGQGYEVSARSSASVIVSDGGTPTPKISIAGGGAINEGGTATFTLTARPKPASNISVVVDISESGGSFAASGQTGSRSVPIGISGKATFSVATENDDTVENNGLITATVLNGAAYAVAHPVSATVGVRDAGTNEPFVRISAGRSIIEGQEAVFTLRASPKPTAAIDVNVSVSGRGNFSDAVGLSNSVKISTDGKGELRIMTDDDDDDEPNGMITVTVESGYGYAVGSPSEASLSVSDNDVQANDLTVSIADAEVVEGDGSMRFKVTLSRPTDGLVIVSYAPKEVPYVVSPATPGEDYYDRGGHVLFTEGETVKYAHILIFDDDEYEPEEEFDVALTGVLGEGAEIDGGLAIGTILPDPHDAERPTPLISITADVNVVEGNDITFTLRADPPPKDDITVKGTISDADGNDFIDDDDEGTREVTFHGDASLVDWTWEAYTVDTVNDSTDEDNGAVIIEIEQSDNESYYVGSPSSAGIIVYDNDGTSAQLPKIAVTDMQVDEDAGALWFSVTVAPPVPEHGTVSVLYYMEQGSAKDGEDYVAQSGTLTFEEGEALKYVVVPIVDDAVQEGAESFTIRLAYPEGATIADAAGIGTINASD